MTFAELAKAIKAGKVPPVLLLHGPEAYFKNKTVEMLRGVVKDVLRYTSAEVPWSQVQEELLTGALFAGRKLIVYAVEKDFFKSEALEQYVKAPSAENVLVLLSDAEKAPAEERKGLVVLTCVVRPADLPKFLVEEFRARGKQIDPSVARLLGELSGGNLSAAEAHVEKLCLYVGARTQVTAQDVEQLVADDHAYKTFDLARELARRKADSALVMLHRLLDSGTPPQMVLAGIAWQYRKMIEIKRLMAAGRDAYMACADAGVRWNQAEWAALVKTYELPELEFAHRQILETDVALKTSGVSEGILFDVLVFKLAGRKSL